MHESQPTDSRSADAETVRPAVQTKRGTAWINVLLGLALFAAVGGLAFAAGRLTALAAAAFPGPNGGQLPGGPTFQGGPDASFQPGAGGPGGLIGNGGITLEGTVASKDADSITLKLANGETVEVSLPSDTTYHTLADATSDGVESGANVRVQVDVQPGQGQGQLAATDVTIVP